MKINVIQVVADYIRTLRGDHWNFFSFLDIMIIFLVPLLAAIATHWFQDSLNKDFFISLFTLFGVFVAVFIAMQGVLVSLHSTSAPSERSNLTDCSSKQRLLDRNRLIKEVSYALSYLKLAMIFGMSILVFAIATGSDLFLFKWISMYLAVHLFFNLLVVSKRLHALFHFQFDEG